LPLPVIDERISTPTVPEPLRHEVRSKRTGCPRRVSPNSRSHAAQLYTMTNGTFGIPLRREEIATLRRVVSAQGVVRAAQRLGISRGVLERALGGLGVRAGSGALVRLALAELARQPESGTGGTP
jgi:hypothetical protein